MASQAAKVVAKTRYLTNNTVQSDGSAIGNVLAALPGQINVALGDRVCFFFCVFVCFLSFLYVLNSKRLFLILIFNSSFYSF